MLPPPEIYFFTLLLVFIRKYMLFSPSALEDLFYLVDKDKGLHLQDFFFGSQKY